MLSQVKLIAEPWDVGPGGYQVGNFPVGWAEWNGKYRDYVRRFWRGDAGQLPELASRLSGSSDLYSRERPRRRTRASTSSTAHDGFTLHDLVSYEQKHNEANGEDNRDGTDDNHQPQLGRRRADRAPSRCRRCARGDAQLHGDAALLAGRADDRRTATRSAARSSGNNNAYCQDNEITWVDWDLEPDEPRAPRVHAHGHRDLPLEPGAAPPELLHGPAEREPRREGHHVAAARRRSR